MEEKNKNKHELERLLEKVIPVINYKGCLVTKTKYGFSVLGISCKTIGEVDREIDKAHGRLTESIKRNM